MESQAGCAPENAFDASRRFASIKSEDYSGIEFADSGEEREAHAGAAASHQGRHESGSESISDTASKAADQTGEAAKDLQKSLPK